MNILGVHIGHDSSVALVKDGLLIADVAEERFTRLKHYNGIPYASVDYCLREGKISIDDLDVVAVSSKYPVPGLNYLFDLNEEQQQKKGVRSQALDACRKYFGG